MAARTVTDPTSPPSPPTFSVVIPAYNRQASVARTVDSVLAQDGPSLEAIVVDDGSSDATSDVLARYDDTRLRAVRIPHSGVSGARNAGARLARGDYLAFLDCDDVAAPDWLARFHELLQGDCPDLVFGGLRAVHPDARATAWLPRPSGPEFGDLTGSFNPGMFAVRRTVFEATGGYSVALTYSENTELGLRLAAELERTGRCRAHWHNACLVTAPMPDGGTNAYDDRARYESALYLLGAHADRLGRAPHKLAAYCAIAGVAAARLGRGNEARHLFLRAARVEPSNPKHLLRAIAASLPRLRSRAWPATAPQPNRVGM